MKTFQLRLVGALLLFAAAYTPACSEPTVPAGRLEFYKQLSGYLISSQALSPRYNAILAKYGSMRTGRKLCVNMPIGSDGCIYLFVVKHQSLVQSAGSDFRDAMRDVQLNAVAYEPSMILVDDMWLDFVLTSAIDEYIYFRSMRQNDVLETRDAIANYIQFINMRRTIRNDAEYAKLGLKTIGEVADIRIAGLIATKKGDVFDQSEQGFLIASLATIIEHEIAHLDMESPYAVGMRSLGKRLDASEISESEFLKALRNLRLEEERRADAVALRIASATMQGQLELHINIAKYDRETIEKMSRFPLLGIANLFLNRALFFGMDQFRGMKAEDILMELSHVPCTEARRRGLTLFNDPKEIRVGRRRPLPILSAQSFPKPSVG